MLKRILSNGAFIKPLCYLLGFVACIFIFKSCEATAKIDKLEKEQKEIINKIKARNQEAIDRNNKAKEEIIENLTIQILELKDKKDSIIKQLPNYEKDPIYDIDFIAAFRIISESNYKQRNPNSNARQGEND